MRNAKIAAGCVVLGTGLMAASFALPSKAAEPAPRGGQVASYYGEELRGSRTASGEVFNPDALTAAHKTLPLGTMLRVCKSGCTTVRVNDRGPFVAGRDLDLSEAAAESIGLEGVEPVEIAGTSEPVTELPATGGEG